MKDKGSIRYGSHQQWSEQNQLSFVLTYLNAIQKRRANLKCRDKQTALRLTVERKNIEKNDGHH